MHGQGRAMMAFFLPLFVTVSDFPLFFLVFLLVNFAQSTSEFVDAGCPQAGLIAIKMADGYTTHFPFKPSSHRDDCLLGPWWNV